MGVVSSFQMRFECKHSCKSRKELGQGKYNNADWRIPIQRDEMGSSVN